MSGLSRVKAGERTDELMERASRALAETKYFECECVAQDALELAFRNEDYERMARILMPLEECRRQIRMQAVDAGAQGILNDVPDEDFVPEPGCWMLEPPLVGADGRALRQRAIEAEHPVIIIVREPKTQLGAWPIVVIGPSTTRAYVSPAKGKPTAAWLLDASEALGDAALEGVDPDATAPRRVNALFDCLCTLRDHDKLHQELAKACQDAAREEQSNQRLAS